MTAVVIWYGNTGMADGHNGKGYDGDQGHIVGEEHAHKEGHQDERKGQSLCGMYPGQKGMH